MHTTVQETPLDPDQHLGSLLASHVDAMIVGNHVRLVLKLFSCFSWTELLNHCRHYHHLMRKFSRHQKKKKKKTQNFEAGEERRHKPSASFAKTLVFAQLCTTTNLLNHLKNNHSVMYDRRQKRQKSSATPKSPESQSFLKTHCSHFYFESKLLESWYSVNNILYLTFRRIGKNRKK